MKYLIEETNLVINHINEIEIFLDMFENTLLKALRLINKGSFTEFGRNICATYNFLCGFVTFFFF